MRKYIRWTIIFLLILVVCSYGFIKLQQGMNIDEVKRKELIIYSSHPADFIGPLIEEFESITGIWVTVVRGGTGELIDRIEEEQDNPYGDILWGGSLSTLKPQKYLFENYYSINEDSIQEEFKNKEGMLTRFTDIPSVIMVNNDLIGDITINGYKDLLNEKLKGKIAFCNPSVSSSAYEHLINMLYAMGGEELGWEYIKQFCENLDGNLLTSSTQVYEGVANGEYVAGLIFEEGAASLIPKGENIKVVYMEEGVVTTPDCVSIVKNALNRDNAREFIDFVTGFDAQTMIAMNLNRRSVRTDVDVPDYLLEKEHMTLLKVDSELISVRKTEWIARFGEIFYDLEED